MTYTIDINLFLHNESVEVENHTRGLAIELAIEGDIIGLNALGLESGATYDEIEERALESFEVLIDRIHLLQYEPSDSQIKELLEHAPNIVVLRIDESYFLGFSCCGMDMSDSLAYGYMVLDGEIPHSIRPRQRLTLSKSAYAELENFLNWKAINRKFFNEYRCELERLK